MADSVSNEHLEQYLKAIANKLATENPALIKPPASIEKLIDDTASLLRYKEQEMDQPLDPERLTDPEFVEQLAVTMTTMATIESSKELSEIIRLLEKALKEFKESKAYSVELKNVMQEENEIMDALFELLEELDDIFEMDASKREKARDKIKAKLKKRLSKKAFKKLEALLNLYFIPMNKDSLKKAIQKLLQAVKANIDKLNKNPHKTHDVANQKEAYANLFGMLSAYITGSHPVPMLSYMGNGLGFTDWNPFHGSANIDSVNEINMKFGDSLGLEARTIQRYFRIEDGTVNQFVDLLRQEHLIKQGQAPEHTNKNLHKP